MKSLILRRALESAVYFEHGYDDMNANDPQEPN
jgi:hypothetical protein